MKKDSTYLGLELIGLTPDNIEKIKKLTNKDVHYKENGERLFLYPVSDKVQRVLDGIGSEINFDEARLRLVWIDIDSDEVKESNLNIPKVELDEEETFDLFDASLAIKFVSDNGEEVEKALNAETESDDQEVAEDQAELVESDEPEISDTEIETEPEQSEEDSEQDGFNTEDVENYFDEDDKDNQTEDDQYSKDDLNKMFNDVLVDDGESAKEGYPEQEEVTDPLMQKAIDIFNTETHSEVLPEFDDKTAQLLSKELTNAKSKLQDARSKTINEIYRVLKDAHDKETNTAKSGSIAEAEKAHDTNVQKIKDNCETQITRMSDQEHLDYQKRKEEAGKAYLAEFYANYDQDNLESLNNEIQAKADPIRNKAAEDIEAENQSLADYIENVNSSIFNHVTNHANVTKFIDDYKKTVSEEKTDLLAEAEKIKSENEDLKNQVENLRRALEYQRTTQDEQINAAIAEANRKWTEELDEEHRKRRDIEKEAELQKENHENQLLENQKLSQQLIEISHKNEAEQNKNAEKKQSNLIKVLIGTVGVFVAFGTGILGYGISAATHHDNTPTAAQIVPSQTSTSQQSASDSSSASSSDVPKTFVYTDQNGKKHNVTKDDDTSGHYVDDQGKTHTVIFK